MAVQVLVQQANTSLQMNSLKPRNYPCARTVNGFLNVGALSLTMLTKVLFFISKHGNLFVHESTRSCVCLKKLAVLLAKCSQKTDTRASQIELHKNYNWRGLFELKVMESWPLRHQIVQNSVLFRKCRCKKIAVLYCFFISNEFVYDRNTNERNKLFLQVPL